MPPSDFRQIVSNPIRGATFIKLWNRLIPELFCHNNQFWGYIAAFNMIYLCIFEKVSNKVDTFPMNVEKIHPLKKK